MPYTLRIDARLGLALVRASGTVTVEEFTAYRRDLASHPEFREGMHLLVDLSDARFEPSAAQVRRLANAGPFSEGSKQAVVVADDLHFGLARMWSMRREGERGSLRPFRTVGEACAWLAVAEEELWI